MRVTAREYQILVSDQNAFSFAKSICEKSAYQCDFSHSLHIRRNAGMNSHSDASCLSFIDDIKLKAYLLQPQPTQQIRPDQILPSQQASCG